MLGDGAVFAGATGDDWDMGEELAAYLDGFGTKTYLYYELGEIRCVNGKIERDGSRYLITSYTAFPREYCFYEENLIFKSSESVDVPRIALRHAANGMEFAELREP